MENRLINLINKEIADAVSFLPPFSMHDVAESRNASIAEHNLQLHRLQKKFSVPNVSDVASLHDDTWVKFLSTEHRIGVTWQSEALTDKIRGNPLLFRRVRVEILKILRYFKLDLGADCGFGKGEQFISSGGMTSAFDKWENHAFTCTRKCFPLFARALYQNRTTRRLVFERCTFRYPFDHTMANDKGYRFRYFSAHLEAITTFIPGNRFSSVPKDNLRRRPICVEGLGNLYVQKGIGSALKRALRDSGCDTWTGQERHIDMIKFMGISTIDFADASDSIHIDCVDFFFPDWFTSLIKSSRASFVQKDDVLYRLNKVSSMGNGFTWELMTVLLLAIARALYSDAATVYGDDVIIEDELALDFMSFCSDIGFVVNESKSYIAHKFKESCGGFTFDGTYLKSFDIEYIHNALQARVVMNKLYMQRDNPFFLHLWQKLIVHVDRDLRGPIPVDDEQIENLSAYYWCDDFPTRTNSSTRWIARAFCYDEGNVNMVKTVKPVGVHVRKDDTRVTRHVDYMLRLKDHAEPFRSVRQDAADLELIYVTLLVHNTSGIICSSRAYKALRNDLTEYLQGIYPDEVLTRDHWESYYCTPTNYEQKQLHRVGDGT